MVLSFKYPFARDERLNDVKIVIENSQIGIGARHDHTFTMKTKSVGGIFRKSE